MVQLTSDLKDRVGSDKITLWRRSLLCELNQVLIGDTSGGVKVDADEIIFVFLFFTIGDNHGASELILSGVFDMMNILWEHL